MIETQVKWRGKLYWFVRKDYYDELHKENQELVNKVLEEIENASRSREELADLKLSIEPTETIINGFANLFDGYVKEKGLKEELKDQTMTAFNLNEIRKDQYKTIETLKDYLCFKLVSKGLTKKQAEERIQEILEEAQNN